MRQGHRVGRSRHRGPQQLTRIEVSAEQVTVPLSLAALPSVGVLAVRVRSPASCRSRQQADGQPQRLGHDAPLASAPSWQVAVRAAAFTVQPAADGENKSVGVANSPSTKVEAPGALVRDSG